MHRGGQHCLRWPSGARDGRAPDCFAANSSGVRLPRLEWGRSRLYSIRHCSILLPRIVERDEDVLVEALLAQPALKLSMKAFWIGLPGSMNCSRTPCS